MGLNHVYKVVWNKTKGCYVVVSELAKRVGRNKAKAIVMTTAAMAMAVSPTVMQNVGAVNDAGTGSADAVALGQGANANQARAIAIGKGATNTNGQDTIAIGTDTKVQGHTSIVIGKNAKITDKVAEGTVVIGRDAFSEGSGKGERPNTVVGRGAYTAFGQNGEYRLNASTAIGLQAGAGVIVDPANNRKLVNNNTNADNNAEVLVKAGYGLDEKAPADTKAALQGGM